MKPTTDTQRRCIELRPLLRPLTARQKNEAFHKNGEIIATKKEAWCTECGHVWEDSQVWKKGLDKGTAVCPHCHHRYRVRHSQKLSVQSQYYYELMDVAGEFQVQRMFFVQKRVTRPSKFYGIDVREEQGHPFIDEVCQIWIGPDAKMTVFAKLVNMSNLYFDLWRFDTKMELRGWHRRYESIGGYIGSGCKFLPSVKQRGLTRLSDEVCSWRQIVSVLTDPISEILLKRGYRNLFVERLRADSKLINVPWEAINVATRHKYKFTDVRTWCDYIGDLQELGLDIHSPHYLCPDDLARTHFQMQARRAKKTTKKEDLAKAERDNPAYVKKMAPYFGLEFTDHELTIRTLRSVKEVLEEGNHLGHCVFRCEYYKNGTLLMTARVDGKRAETVEISTKEFIVLQSRGYGDTSSPYHKRIVRLVNRNMGRIQRIANMCANA